MPHPALQPLRAVTVWELTEGIVGSWCGQQLRRLGATVIHWQVSPERAWFQMDHSLRARMLEGKRLREFPSYGELREELCQEMASPPDMLIVEENVLQQLEGVEKAWQGMPLLCVRIKTGEREPLAMRDSRSYELFLQQQTGLLAMNGQEELGALPVGFYVAQHFAGMAAATGALAAWMLRRSAAGGYQELVVSAVQAAAHIMQVPYARMQFEAHTVKAVGPAGTLAAPSGFYPCQDGWVGIFLPTDQDWEDFVHLSSLPELADERFFTLEGRQKLREELAAVISRWTRQFRVAELVETGQLWRLPFVPVALPWEVHLPSRPWREIQHGDEHGGDEIG